MAGSQLSAKSISRRDSIRILAFAGLGGLAACSPIISGTTEAITPTLAPSKTLYPTAPSTKTPTREPTLIARPTESPFPLTERNWVQVWKDEGDARGMNQKSLSGGRYEVIKDPTGSNRGLVIKEWFTGPMPDENGQRKRRAQIGHDFSGQWSHPKVLKAPCLFETELWYSRNLTPTKDRWVAIGSLFSQDLKTRISTSTFGILIIPSEENYDLILHNKEPDAGRVRGTRIINQQLHFPYEQWVRVGVSIEADGNAFLFQDGIPIERVQLINDVALGASRVSWGLYGGVFDPYDESRDFLEGTYGLTDNSVIYQEQFA